MDSDVKVLRAGDWNALWRPCKFPVRIRMPINDGITVMVKAQGYVPFHMNYRVRIDEPNPDEVIEMVEDRPLGLYGLLEADLPAHTGFQVVHPPEEGSPMGVVFELGSSAGMFDWQPNLIVDVRGEVWEYPPFRHSLATEPRRVGRVEFAMFEKMKSLRAEAVKGELVDLGTPCVCEGSGFGFLVHGTGKHDDPPVAVAYDGQTRARRPSSAAFELLAWVLKVQRQATPPP